MTDQENQILEEEVNTETVEKEEVVVDETVEDALETEPVPENTEAELDAGVLQVQLDELNQRFLRTAADFENYKRRTALEKEDLLKYSNAKIIGEILPVLDNFQMALKTTSDNKEVQNVVKGVDMIYRQLLQVLEQAGMTKIEAVGHAFDPNLHEAIMQVDDDSVPEDTVVEELRAGYMLKERVIRPTMVKVSR